MVWDWSRRIPGHQLSRLKVRHTTVLGACEVVWGVQDSTCSEWPLRCSLVVRAGLRRFVLCFEPFEEWQCCGHCDSSGLRKRHRWATCCKQIHCRMELSRMSRLPRHYFNEHVPINGSSLGIVEDPAELCGLTPGEPVHRTVLHTDGCKCVPNQI